MSNTTPNPTEKEIKAMALDLAPDHIEIDGLLNMTTLAEAVADEFDNDDWLDDETSYIWDAVFEVGEALENL